MSDKDKRVAENGGTFSFRFTFLLVFRENREGLDLDVSSINRMGKLLKENGKIKDLGELSEILARIRSSHSCKKVVHCHGVFDLLHIGHIRYLEQAKKLGDVLVVSLTQDKHVNKGPHRPAFTESLRAEALAALNCVDYVTINQCPTAVETIQLLRPDIYAKGAEYKTNRTEEILREEAAVQSVGCEIAFIEDITSSSSFLINRHLEIFPKEVREFLDSFAKIYSADDILGHLKSLRSLKALVVGEAIIDEYHYCEAIGKSSKEPALAAKYLSTEMFAGGALAISNHIAGFCDRVSLLTVLGTENSHEDFIRRHLKSNIEPVFLYKKNAPTIVKRRFLESYFFSKFFELYFIDDRDLNEAENRSLCTFLNELLPEYDLVIVADYGHGMLTKDSINMLCNKSIFLAVNTQVNAGNRGFNTISKYPRANFICINEGEVRLEMRDRQGDIKDIIGDLSQRLACDQILVTQGKYGTLSYTKNEGFTLTPAFATRVVDRIGAGDAVLSLTSLCAAKNIPPEILGFVANVVGAEATAIIGNRSSIEPTPLFRHIGSLLK